MRKGITYTISLLLLIFFYTKGTGQEFFEAGYFINNSGIKTTCLINDLSWQSNPHEFIYKLTENSGERTGSLETVKEFGILDHSKYVRANIHIDRSSDNVNNLSSKRNPEFRQELQFLKVLVEGNATLYSYRDSFLKRYFFRSQNLELEQLIYKKYRSDWQNNSTEKSYETDHIKTNERYKQQLWSNLGCEDISRNRVEVLDYKRDDLVKFFIEYNQGVFNLENPNKESPKELIVYNQTNKKKFFQISIKPSVNSLTSKTITFGDAVYNYKNKTTLGVALEAEMILPFHNNEWSIFFQTYLTPSDMSRDMTRVPLGLRYSVFLNKKSKFTISPSYSILMKELATSIGYHYNNKYSIEMKYCFFKERYYSTYSRVEYNGISLFLGYSL